jgi:hypothetical protein
MFANMAGKATLVRGLVDISAKARYSFDPRRNMMK